MAATDLPMNGKNSRLLLFYGGAKVPGVDGHVLSWTAKEVATKFRDSLINRARKRTDKTVDGYDVEIEVEVHGMELFSFLKGLDDSRDASAAMKSLAVGLELNRRTGEIDGVLFADATASFELTDSGGSERIRGKVMLEAESMSALAL